jgi:hypothetical protein
MIIKKTVIAALAVVVLACALVITAGGCQGKGGDKGKAITWVDYGFQWGEGRAAAGADWAGEYFGTLPCASCPGIETRVVLNGDWTYQLSLKYLDRDGEPFQNSGKFQWDIGGDRIILRGLDKDGFAAMFRVGEDALVQLDLDGNEVDGNLADKYILEKIKPRDEGGSDGGKIMLPPPVNKTMPFDIDSIPFGGDFDKIKQAYGIDTLRDIIVTDWYTPEGHKNFVAAVSGDSAIFRFFNDELDKVFVIYDFTERIPDENQQINFYDALVNKIAKFCDNRLMTSGGAAEGQGGEYTWDYDGKLAISIEASGFGGVLDMFKIIIHIERMKPELSRYKDLEWGSDVQAVRQVYKNLEEISEEGLPAGVKVFKYSSEGVGDFDDEDWQPAGEEQMRFYFYQGKLYQVAWEWRMSARWNYFDPVTAKQVRALQKGK